MSRPDHPAPTPFPSTAVGVALLAVVVVFFPTLFFGRVLSPLDALFNDPPWNAVHHPVEVTNPELRPAVTIYYPLMVQAQRDGLATAAWSPYTACGGAGTMSLDSGLLSPYTLPFLPWLDEAQLLNGMVLAKLLAAFAGTYLLLCRCGRTEVAATTGAASYALTGSLTARWLWPVSGAFATLPLLLWAIDRTVVSRTPGRAAAVCTAVWLAFLASGSPEATAVGACTAAGWIVIRVARSPSDERRRRVRGAVTVGAGLVVAAAILAPSVGLAVVSPAQPIAVDGAATGWGWTLLRLVVNPFAFGDPRQDTFDPPPHLGPVSFRNTNVTLGLMTMVLAAIGLATRPRRELGWCAVLAAALAAMAWTPAWFSSALVPGPGRISPTDLAPIAALACAALAAAGSDRLQALVRPAAGRNLATVLAAGVVLELGLLAGHLHAYLPPDVARFHTTDGLERLQRLSAENPVRTAPLLDILWPDTAAAYRVEDVRAQLRTTDDYRRLLQTIDPQVWGHFGDVLRLNAATIDLLHPYLRALGARWVLEPPSLRLVEYALGDHTIEIEPRSRLLGPVVNGDEVTQELELPEHCSRLGVHATTQESNPMPHGELRVVLVDESAATEVAAWSFPVTRLVDEGMLWLDLPSGTASGRRHRLTITPHMPEGALWLWQTPDPHSLPGRLLWRGRTMDGDLALSFDTSGYATVYEGDDLRIWENRRAAQRFWIVRSVIPGSLDTLIAADPPLPLESVAVVPPNRADAISAALTTTPAPDPRSDRVLLASWTPTSYTLRVELAEAALLVSSIPADPPLWTARVDERRVQLETANGLFLALALPSGRHDVEVTAAVPALWYGCSLIGAAIWVGLALHGLWARHQTSPRRALRRSRW